jgi:hypothetical protein
MTTGRHLIRDLHCVACGHLVGWRYEYAYERREKVGTEENDADSSIWSGATSQRLKGIVDAYLDLFL